MRVSFDARTFIGACILIASLSCGDSRSTTEPPSGTPGARILTPRTVDDTIEALLLSNLLLEVRDSSGRPASNVKVTVSSHLDVPNPFILPLATFSLSPGAPVVLSLSEVTNVAGQLSLSTRLGAGVASGWITVDAGAAGRDSIHVVIHAGMPARLTLTPRDTALAVGTSYTLSAGVADRQGNVLSNVPTLVSRRPQVGSVTSGLTIRASSAGPAFMVGTVGTALDSVAVEVVPSGTLMAFRFIQSSGDVTTVATFELDGSNYQRTLLPGYGFNNYSPHWLAQQNMLVFHGRTGGFGNEVGMFTMGTSHQPKVLYAPTVNASGVYPQPSRDGAWIYYAQQVGWQSFEVWRMRPDGSARARVGPVAGYYDSYSQPTPSPDGSSVVYMQNDGGNGSGVVRLMRLDLATGQSSALGAFGSHPRWSPVANEIAYLTSTAVRIVQSDGTGDRALATGVRFDDRDGQLDWSPDGKWLVVCTWFGSSGGRRLALVERATGEVMPLPFSKTENLCEATWTR